MNSRDQILDDVRKAVGRKPGQPPQPPPAARIRIPEISVEQRIALFTERLEVLGGKVYRAATLRDACHAVASILGDDDAVATNAPILQKAGIIGLPRVSSGFRDEPSLRASCSTAPYGISGADYGLAETGSLVTRAVTEARFVSLLPPAHIALLPKNRLLTGLDEFYALVPNPAEASSSTVFITGPSRSADIEMILVRGVHGPRVIHVIVVDEDA